MDNMSINDSIASNSETKVQLFISGIGLDPTNGNAILLKYRSSETAEWISAGQTELILHNPNPDFLTQFHLNYYFQEQTYLKFVVVKQLQESLAEQQLAGEIDCTLGEIVGSHGQQVIKGIKKHGKYRGQLVISVEQLREWNEKCNIKCKAIDIEDVSGFFGSFKPFFSLLRSMTSGTFQRVYTSEVTKGKSPDWDQFEISSQSLCNGDYQRTILIEVSDYSSIGRHTLVGTGTFNLNEVSTLGLRKIRLINGNKISKPGYKDSGIFEIEDISIKKEFTFLDYISGGCQINLIAAVDFTASNGNAYDPNSLHFLNPAGMNQYETALNAVGEILLNYDTDKLVPMFGFGGKIKGEIMHWFHMNFNKADPNVLGIKGMMNSYRNSLNMVELSGPTLFSHVLKMANQEAERAQVSQTNQQYFLLLILTDGEIHDLRETIDLIVEGSKLPLSVVIVGLGNDSFENMVLLDADYNPLISSNGEPMERDIVQFVPYRDVNNSPTQLASEVLDEIPRELVNYFQLRGIKPNSPITPAKSGMQRPMRKVDHK